MIVKCSWGIQAKKGFEDQTCYWVSILNSVCFQIIGMNFIQILLHLKLLNFMSLAMKFWLNYVVLLWVLMIIGSLVISSWYSVYLGSDCCWIIGFNDLKSCLKVWFEELDKLGENGKLLIIFDHDLDVVCVGWFMEWCLVYHMMLWWL